MGGRHLGYFFVVVVFCFIFREYLSMLTSKCLVDLVASQDEKFLSIICVLLSPAVGVLHIMFKIFIVMLMLDLAGNNLIFHENLKTKTGSPCQSFARCYHVGILKHFSSCRPAFKVLANEDTLFPRLPARATFVADTNFVSGTQKCFWFCSEALCVRNKYFPVCAAQETSWATMCPRLPGPLNTT